ncbi:P-loop containing nucleoside triphosphate hydrolase [Vibrio phage 1.244.A._10N.261.54.C3]|nr:P-loop containing nucleoside triphosphate hydrolase [Vibrio phage 1.244.A._10N.261.54.C3]AUR98802.1 P-loop containing nucleoside triphosphate hydrolase [Vibrio phage 1.255.O._10N.286.45.F1]
MVATDNIVVLCGRKGSGKDFLAERLNGYVRLSFSDELRILAHDLFPWCPLDPSYKEKDQVIDHPDNVMGLTPRGVWLRLADNNDPSLRNIDPKLLVNRFMERHLHRIQTNPRTMFVVTDLRSPQEDERVEAMGWPKVRILQPNRDRDDEDSFEDYVDQIRVDREWVHHRNGDGGFTQLIGELLA